MLSNPVSIKGHPSKGNAYPGLHNDIKRVIIDPALAGSGAGWPDWVLVSEPGFCKALAHSHWKSNSFTRNQAQEQHSLLDTVFDYIFCLGPPGKSL